SGRRRDIKIPAILTGKNPTGGMKKHAAASHAHAEAGTRPGTASGGKLPKPVELPIGRNSSEVELQMAQK
ncbi:hypothetical protein, partial [Desulfovibrio sp.]|uniref:hypothetical protein n=1 Tax=Desulfovibrio sp. TaxID=885 RepID=UPI0023BBD149